MSLQLLSLTLFSTLTNLSWNAGGADALNLQGVGGLHAPVKGARRKAKA